MNDQIKIIDLFAGPGGLGEGFSTFSNDEKKPFKINFSVEKEVSAHKTLKLRAFYRQFPVGEAPKEYYDYLSGNLGKDPEEVLFKNSSFSDQVTAASIEARQLTLGKDNSEIEKSIELALGKKTSNWVLIGGPPCQAYSLVGRSRNAGIKGYKVEDDHRNFLYLEYLNIISRFKPAVFVMENVKGILSAKVDGELIFDKIKEDLHCPSKAVKSKLDKHEYEIFSLVVDSEGSTAESKDVDPRSYIIRSEQYGIPQARHRVILLGVRSDLAKKIAPGILLPKPSITIQDVIQDLPRLRSGLSKHVDSSKTWKNIISTQSKPAMKEIRNIGLDAAADCMEKAIKKMAHEELGRGSNWTMNRSSQSEMLHEDNELKYWYRDPKGWSGVCNHESRSHIQGDLLRYLFCSAFGQAHYEKKWSPKGSDFPKELAPNHKSWETGKFSDRFRVQASYRHATTITSHISKDGHYFIHYDPTQCRSLTVREAARVQTFPDNYFFVGTRTQQYTQVGNAVPPFLAKQIAEVVYQLLRGQ